MHFIIKLKVGFFKTMLYRLSLEEGELILTPQENPNKTLIIKNHELQTVSFLTKDTKSGEIEIVTNNSIYRGSMETGEDMEKLERALAKEFGKQIIIKKSNFT